MNLRIQGERTPARRLAALLRTYLNLFLDPPPPTPDYADIAEQIEPYTFREELLARKSELEAAAIGSAEEGRAYFRRRGEEIDVALVLTDRQIEISGVISERRAQVIKMLPRRDPGV